MRRARAEIQLALNTALWSKQVATVENKFTRLKYAAAAMGTAAAYALGRLAVEGVKLNAALEDVNIGIATVLRATQGDRFASFNEALAYTRTLMDQLRESAKSSSASLTDLQQGFLTLAGPMAAANIPTERQVELLTLMANATRLLAGTGGEMSMKQLVSESKALLEGRFSPAASIVQTLFARPEDKARLKGAVEGGGGVELTNLLIEKFGAFQEGADAMRDTFNTLLVNVNDALKEALRIATSSAFEQAKASLRDVYNQVSSPEFLTGMKALSNFVLKVLGFAAKVGTSAVSVLGGMSTVGFNKAGLGAGMAMAGQAAFNSALSEGVSSAFRPTSPWEMKAAGVRSFMGDSPSDYWRQQAQNIIDELQKGNVQTGNINKKL